ncbi:PH domain-containing protein [Candidatus Uhrbacteria bacterium]|nr:PH domain-containing protein [Candidatus Uhrbacteria bacterium]
MDVPKYIELKPREEVQEVVHTSLIPRFWKLALLIIWTILPFFLAFPLWREGSWGVGVFCVWLLSGLIVLGRTYFMWARTVFLITDKRVIDHDQKGFFYRVVTEARYDQIDEVSYYVKGIVPTLFRFGTLSLQLRGASADIQVDHVSHPDRLTNLINDFRSTSPTIPHADS